MIVTAHEGNDNSDMTKIIGSSAYVTAVGETIPDGWSLYAKNGNDIRYSVIVASDYEEAKRIKRELEEKENDQRTIKRNSK